MIICGFVRSSISISSNSFNANSHCGLEVSAGHCRTCNHVSLFHCFEDIGGIDHEFIPAAALKPFLWGRILSIVLFATLILSHDHFFIYL